MLKLKKLFALLAGLVCVVALTSCAPPKKAHSVPSDDAPAAVVVEAGDNYFKAKDVTVKVGEAVQWKFVGSMSHDVASEDGSFVSELQLDGTYTHIFTKPGVYKYRCTIHSEMTGTVTVTQ